MKYYRTTIVRPETAEEIFRETELDVMEDWQAKCRDIKMRMVNLYHSHTWTDCTFLVGNQTISAHKLVLASSSPVFTAMFFGELSEKNGPIHIDDIEPSIFIAMLRYIYTDTTDIGSYDDACALYYAAKKYMLIYLKKECLKFLIDSITPDDCLLAYEFAQMFEEITLLNACDKVMKTATLDLLKSDSFLNASLKTVRDIYSMSLMNINSELDLFVALERYVEANYKNQTSGPSNEDNRFEDRKQIMIENAKESAAEDYILKPKKRKIKTEIAEESKPQDVENENISSITEDEDSEGEAVEDSKASEEITIRDILKRIHFLSMTPEEFTSIPATSSLLTQAEALAILMNIIDKGQSKLPMPEGFYLITGKRYKQEIDLDAMQLIKFKFTVTKCKYLDDGDVIHFPEVSYGYCSWKMNITISDDDCYFYATITTFASVKYDFTLHISLERKEDTKKYQLDSKGLMELKVYLDTWDDIKSHYLDDDTLYFEVEIRPTPHY